MFSLGRFFQRLIKLKAHLNKSFFRPKGKWQVFHYRKGQLIDIYNFENDITTEGKNTIFDVMFNNGTQIANNSWFIGLINITGYSTLAPGDTMAAHGGWTEFTNYDEVNRVAWGSGAAASASVTNATPATFTINASGTIKGIFVTSNNTKGGTSGKLWSTALFSGDVNVVDNDELKVTYTISA